MGESTIPFGECPWCKQSISVTYRAADMQPLATLHALPMCAEYERMDADDYLKSVLEIRQAAGEA